MPFKPKPFDRRIRLLVLAVIFIFGFSAIFLRSWQLHILADARISKIEKRSQKRIVLSSRRKTIFDRQGRPLAMSLKVPSVFVDPETFMPSRKQLRNLSTVVGLSSANIQKKIKNGSRRFAWLKRFLSPHLSQSLQALDITGLFVTHEWKRFYPEKELAGQVLGFVGIDGKGLEGIERQYDEQLRKEEIIIRAKRDGRGRVIYSENTGLDVQARQKDVYLSIDANIQYILEEEIAVAAKKHGALSAMGVLMDAYTGDVLGMASYPFVNPNQFNDFSPRLWRNRPIQETFEPGSTFKVFTVAAALDQKVIRPDQSIHCEEGSLQFGRKKIKNTVEKASWLTPRGILKYSNNVGAARIGLEMQRDAFFQSIRKFGFGVKTGIKYPGETSGILSAPNSWYPIDVANISFGQGIGVSSIQIAKAFSAVANGGHRVRPNLIIERPRPIGEGASNLKKRILSKKTSNMLRKWLEEVTDIGGTGKRAWVEGYRFAGKTGTAQLIDKTTGGYSHSKFISSFMGMGPMPNARYVLAISFREPKEAIYGGQIAAPVFASSMQRVLQYLNVPPHATKPKIVASSHQAHQAATPKQPMQNEKSSPALKPLIGKTIKEVLVYALEADLKVSINGSGIAYNQSVSPGTAIDDVSELTVYFASPVGKRGI